MKIGDKVRFLNQTGGGIVVGFGKRGWATVEDEDGFEIPMPEKECVVIEENVVARQGKNIQTKDGEKLNAALVYTKEGKGFACTLANECNYCLLATYTANNSKGDYYTLFAGEVLPYERKEIFRFGKEELNDYSKRILVRLVPFKRGSGFSKTAAHRLKPVIEEDMILDPMNLLKDGMFKENAYITGKGYVLPVVNENVEELPLSGKDEEKKLKEALREKFAGEAAVASKPSSQPKEPVHRAFINGKWIEIPHRRKDEAEDKSLIRNTASGIMEVDLHAGALLETTAGMDNTAILKYQLEQFNKAMKAVCRKHGQKIVFIHGKGDGVLRKALLAELRNRYPSCRYQDASFREYGYGATMVIIG